MSESIFMEWANAKCRYSVWAGSLPVWVDDVRFPERHHINRLISQAEAERTWLLEKWDDSEFRRAQRYSYDTAPKFPVDRGVDYTFSRDDR